MTHSNDDFHSTATLETLRERAELLHELRNFFREREYWEIETPLLSHDIVVDAHLEPFRVPSRQGESLFLQTSPEFAMKRLVAGGADAIFQICKAFREGEAGAYHNPEFTIVEWYQVGTTYRQQMTLVEDLVRRILARGRAARGITANPFDRTTYDSAFERVFGSTVLDKSAGDLVRICTEHNVAIPTGLDDSSRDELLNLMLAERLEAQLGRETPEFLFDYPDSQAALARVRSGSPSVAERFELYIDGTELCNGYQELTDATELRSRIQQQNTIRIHDGRQPLPASSRLLDAMDYGLPECSGVALGFDRLAMLALGKNTVAEVIPFPIDRA